jgi:H+/Cl- antiporter ClcA
MMALGIVLGPTASLLLQLGLAPDEFQHSPKLRILLSCVVITGLIIGCLSELLATFSRPRTQANDT